MLIFLTCFNLVRKPQSKLIGVGGGIVFILLTSYLVQMSSIKTHLIQDTGIVLYITLSHVIPWLGGNHEHLCSGREVCEKSVVLFTDMLSNFGLLLQSFNRKTLVSSP